MEAIWGPYRFLKIELKQIGHAFKSVYIEFFVTIIKIIIRFILTFERITSRRNNR